MKLEQQVTSLELSKKLKELGIKQDAFWSWYDSTDYDDTPRLNRTDENCPTCCLPQQTWEAKYSAFTVAELGEMLPGDFQHKIREETYTAYLHFDKDCNDEWNLWVGINRISQFGDFTSTKEADARAKLLIYLLENKLIRTPVP
jgi:hypothetical protein